jgi:hypothetical protein
LDCNKILLAFSVWTINKSHPIRIFRVKRIDEIA